MAKNQAASELAKRRWQGVSQAEKSQVGSDLAKAAADSMTAEQRKSRASKAAKARWKKRRKTKADK